MKRYEAAALAVVIWFVAVYLLLVGFAFVLWLLGADLENAEGLAWAPLVFLAWIGAAVVSWWSFRRLCRARR